MANRPMAKAPIATVPIAIAPNARAPNACDFPLLAWSSRGRGPLDADESDSRVRRFSIGSRLRTFIVSHWHRVWISGHRRPQRRSPSAVRWTMRILAHGLVGFNTALSAHRYHSATIIVSPRSCRDRVCSFGGDVPDRRLGLRILSPRPITRVSRRAYAQDSGSFSSLCGRLRSERGQGQIHDARRQHQSIGTAHWRDAIASSRDARGRGT